MSDSSVWTVTTKTIGLGVDIDIEPMTRNDIRIVTGRRCASERDACLVALETTCQRLPGEAGQRLDVDACPAEARLAVIRA